MSLTKQEMRHELVHFWTQALDGLDDETLFPDSALNDAIAWSSIVLYVS